MEHILLFTFLLLSCLSLQGQEITRAVQSSGGITNTSGSITLSSTIGEPIDLALTDGSNWLIQGFEQPLQDTAITTFLHENVTVEITIYPNPTFGPIFIDLNGSQSENLNLNLDIFNVDGQNLFNEVINRQNHSIDLSQLPAATYLMRIRNPKNEIIQTIKVQKLN